MLGLEDAVAAALDDLEAVIEPLDEAAVVALDEVVADRLVPVRQRAEEALEAGHGLALDIEAPVGEPLQAGGAVGGGVEDVGQILAQFIGSTQGRGAHRANASSHSMKTP